MTRGPIALAASLAALAGFTLIAAGVSEGRPHGASAAGHRPAGRPAIGPHGFGHSHVGSHVGPHGQRFVPRRFVSPFVGVYAAPLVYYAPPLYDPSTAYTPSPYYDASAGYGYGSPGSGMISVAPSPPPPPPSVAGYPTPRYDPRGVAMPPPYGPGFIPGPPPPPPPGDGQMSGEPAPARIGRLYRWTDEEGVAHWTDRWDSVPQRYRAEIPQPPSR